MSKTYRKSKQYDDEYEYDYDTERKNREMMKRQLEREAKYYEEDDDDEE
jgi:hypothetical protein